MWQPIAPNTNSIFLEHPHHHHCYSRMPKQTSSPNRLEFSVGKVCKKCHCGTVVCIPINNGSLLHGYKLFGCDDPKCGEHAGVKHGKYQCDGTCSRRGYSSTIFTVQPYFPYYRARYHAMNFHQNRTSKKKTQRRSGATVKSVDYPPVDEPFHSQQDSPAEEQSEHNLPMSACATDTSEHDRNDPGVKIILPSYQFSTLKLRKYLAWVLESPDRSFVHAIGKMFARASMGKECTELMEFSSNIGPGSLLLFLSVSRMVMDSSARYKEMLSRLLRLVLPSGYFHEDIERLFKIPTTTAQFRSAVHNKSSNNSLVNILPILTSTVVEQDGHSHVSLNETIAHSFLCYKPVETYKVHPRLLDIVQGPGFVNALLDNPLDKVVDNIPKIVCYVMLWHDGWDPHSCKNNRKPVWTLTATVVHTDYKPQEEHVFQPYYHRTYVLSCGPGKSSHECAFRFLQHDLLDGGENLHSTHSTFHGCNVAYCVKLGFHLADQPERRDSLGMLAGNSKMHALFGHSCSFNDLEKPFVACDDCALHNRLYMQRGDCTSNPDRVGCHDCHSWSIDLLLRNGQYKRSPVQADVNPGEPGHSLLSRPCRLLMQLLKDGFRFAKENYAKTGRYLENNIKEYLGLMCVNENTIKMFATRARNSVALEQSSVTGADSVLTDQERQFIVDDA